VSSVPSYQYPLRLPPLRRLERRDFLVGAANRAALAFVEAWPNWPGPVLILRGPRGSGKSHLAHIWSGRARALELGGDALKGGSAREVLGGVKHLLIEHCDLILSRHPELEETFYALFGAVAERGGSMLLTARRAPAAWDVRLADLRSRLLEANQVAIGIPDDALLTCVFLKLMSDRQLESNPQVVRYILPRIERSLESLQLLADRLDAGAMAASRRRRRVTIPLAKRALRSLEAEPDVLVHEGI